MSNILILGGYGNFGKRISKSLVAAGLPVIIAGRSWSKAEALAKELKAFSAVFDINKDLEKQLKTFKPKVVINTCGPFQNKDYSIAQTCINNNAHYIDLADARDFVCNIKSLDESAKKARVLVVSGASTVPTLSSAVIEEFKNEFSEIDSMVYGITPGQKTERGLATTQSVLSYLGKPIRLNSTGKVRYGWQDLYRQEYPEIGKRWMANCDAPDLDIFSKLYNIKSVQFSAGMESSALHLLIWLLSSLKMLGLPIKLENHAELLLNLSHNFDVFGTKNGGMHVLLKGKDKQGAAHERKWFIVAKQGHGPQIPCVPAIILAKRLFNNELTETGAKPCIGMLNLPEYLAELKGLDIQTFSTTT